MKILITGANGFIGKNLLFNLRNQDNLKIFTIEKRINLNLLEKKVISSDLIFHLAGVNRGNSKDYFDKNNSILTKSICDILIRNNKKTKIIFSSSIQANKKNYYGLSKKKSEEILLSYKKKTGAQVLIYRLPNVFGKWSKPFYNSVIATFCWQILNDKKVNIRHPKKIIKFLYIDDLINDFLSKISIKEFENSFAEIKKTFSISLNDLANLIKNFKKKTFLIKPDFSNDFTKNLYSTYLSFANKKNFSYKIKKLSDERGFFSEFLKNNSFGQISFFSILPNKTRGNHYHHSKIEKFIVINGKVRFNFVNIINKKKFSILSDENKNIVINTFPGWAHNIINISSKPAKILVWSNEIFDRNNPDTFLYKF
jgi:UDP-2-acetamido-2,6-beta-L-arabino-hexul-4-ose reductase